MISGGMEPELVDIKLNVLATRENQSENIGKNGEKLSTNEKLLIFHAQFQALQKEHSQQPHDKVLMIYHSVPTEDYLWFQFRLN